MSDVTQANHPAQLSVIPGLSEDQLLLERFVMTERLSRPFELVAEVLSVGAPIDLQPHLGKGVGIKVGTGVTLLDRYFHGVLYETLTLDIDGRTSRYRLTLRPWLTLLDLGMNTRIFQNQSVQDIIKKVFSDAGFSAFSMSLATAGSKPRNYCVQFRESDFHFVSRLMEEEGIYYYFAHSESGHQMMLCEKPGDHPAFSGGTVDVIRHDEGYADDAPRIRSWERRLRPSIIKATLSDTHFQQTTTDLSAKATDTSVNPAEAAEHYDFPGGHGYFNDAGSEPGAPYVNTRLLQRRADRETYLGRGEPFAIPVGQKVTVVDGTVSKEVMVVAATHVMGAQDYSGAGDSGDAPADFHMEFEGVPSDTQWKAPSVTRKPLAGGPQVATVVGASGEVVDVDQYGRVKVQFPWDRVGTNDENSSCWVRVSQGWADGQFGVMNIPRIGEEVVVDFLDGDPDRPLITGRVYNSKLMPPYALPGEKTKSTWKSKTVGDLGSYPDAENEPSKNNGDSNEVRFEDKGGSEEFFIHATRLFNAWYRLDETRKTGRDTTVRVGRNRTVNIAKNETTTIETGDETRAIQQGSRTTTIQKADTLELKTGDYSMKVDMGQVTIEAMQQITLKVGQNTIVISQQGIEMQGLTFKATAQTTLSVQGLTTEFKASTMNTISGAMVMIN